MNIFYTISLCILLAGVPESKPAPGEAAILPVKILSKEPETDIVSLNAGRRAGVSLGDPFWIIDDTQMCGFGKVYFLTETACVGRFLYSSSDVPCSVTARVLLNKSLVDLRRTFPHSATIHGKISRLAESGTAWVDVGRSAGLQLKDTILIRRKNIPIAMGKVKDLESNEASIMLERLVGNALSQVDDAAELWPAPGEGLLRINSTVLAVKSMEDGDEITIVGNADDGFTDGRLVDIYRDNQFVGVAALLKMQRHPLSQGKMIKSASRDNPREGDSALVRAGVGPPPTLLIAPVFRVVNDYCLVAAGEVDGLQRDEKLRVYSDQRKPIAEITIDKVNEVYSGGAIRFLDPIVTALPQWSFAERVEPHLPMWKQIGSVKVADSRWRWCVVALNPGVTVESGRVLGLKIKDPISTAAGIALAQVRDGHLLYVPPGWGDVDHLKGAMVELGENLGATSRPVESEPAGK